MQQVVLKHTQWGKKEADNPLMLAGTARVRALRTQKPLTLINALMLFFILVSVVPVDN